jgi:hypothetical protein
MLQGKRHQQNLAKRAAREAAEKQAAPAPQRRVQIKKTGEWAGTTMCDSIGQSARVALLPTTCAVTTITLGKQTPSAHVLHCYHPCVLPCALQSRLGGLGTE